MDHRSFLKRVGVPVHQNLPADTVEEARTVARGNLTMHVCGNCGFVFNNTFDSDLMSYDSRYDNTQTCSPGFEAHVVGLIKYLVNERGVRDCTVVEVGCGKGDFITRLVDFPEANITGFGFDPTYVGPETLRDGRLRFVRRFYDEHAAEISADIVVCRHVIEHVPAPTGLVQSMHKAVAHRPTALVCIETPDVRWIFKHRVVWDFFYEHCSLFSPSSLGRLLRHYGFEVESISNLFGGQYMWAEARPRSASQTDPIDPEDIVAQANEFSAAERSLVDRWRQLLEQSARKHGSQRIGVWGAGAKGVTFANLLDPTAQQIRCFIETNPRKQNKFIPGTGHPIIAPSRISAEKLEDILVLNPNYVEEMSEFLKASGYEAELTDVMAVAQ